VTTSQTHILLVSGPAGVGKSTLGYEIGTQLRQAGVAHVILDSDELDRVWPLNGAEQEALNRANLAAFWINASALGHCRLVLVGVFLDPDANRTWIDAAIPGAKVTRIVLDAPDEELERRVRTREIGSGAEDQLTRTLVQAHNFRRRNAGSPDLMATNGVAVAELARQVIERSRWLLAAPEQA
jgi:predicted ABC-type ATPase